MKKTLAAFGLAATLLASPATLAGSDSDSTIVEIASSKNAFSTLVKAVKQARLVETLNSDGPFTVFAPTNNAFGALPSHTLDTLLMDRNRDRLRSVLTYHVVEGDLTAKTLKDKTTVTTVNGQRLSVETRGDGLYVNDARVVTADVDAGNGVIHAIDAVLLPTTADVVEVANSAGQFGTLLSAAQKAGLVETLRGDGPLTILAPTDAAFDRLGRRQIAALLQEENREQLKNILTYHVIEGRVYAEDALAQGRAKTVQGESVRFSIRDGEVHVNNARVLGNDIEASNGVIHVINSVLVPEKKITPKPDGRLVLGIFTERPSRALAAQLAVERDEALVVTGVVNDSGADKAGLRQYDVIVGVDGHPATSRAISRAKERAGFQGKVELVVIRNGERRTINVTVGVERD